jgi:hypothetical protein
MRSCLGVKVTCPDTRGADHAENLGPAPAIAESNPELLKNAWGKMQHDLVKQGIEGATKAYDNWMATTAIRKDPLKEMTALTKSIWQKLIEAADKYNKPGRFTALIGYEWTSMPDGNNLHRNGIFRDGKDKADQIVPFSQYDSTDPEDFWKWMAAYEQKPGSRLRAIPHNGNLSKRAFYYVRVLEIPTPRWTIYDAKVFGVKGPEDVLASIQERAYTSPIWYTPGN